MSLERSRTIGNRDLDYATPEIFGGIAVSRAVSVAELSDVFEAIKSTAADLAFSGYLRDGSNGDARFGLTQIELQHTRSLRLQQDFTTTEILDDIYNSVPTLRKPMTVKTSGTRALSNRTNGFRILSIGFDIYSEHTILEERNQIQEVIGQYVQQSADTEIYDSIWPQKQIPHISLFKIAVKSNVDKRLEAVKKAVKDELPTEIKLDRAAFFIPQIAPKAAKKLRGGR